MHVLLPSCFIFYILEHICVMFSFMCFYAEYALFDVAAGQGMWKLQKRRSILNIML